MARISIYDTTLRDGSQGEGVNFSLQDKLLITRRLDELGVDYIEGGYPLSNPKDFEYFHEVAKIPLRHAKVGEHVIVDGNIPAQPFVGAMLETKPFELASTADAIGGRIQPKSTRGSLASRPALP